MVFTEIGHGSPEYYRAVEKADELTGRMLAALQDAGIAERTIVLITADHGNAEQMFDPATGQAHTAHTTCLVPLVYVGRPATMAAVGTGALEDIAPTMLTLLGLPIPSEMTGQVLVTLRSENAAVGQRA